VDLVSFSVFERILWRAKVVCTRVSWSRQLQMR
jgi:hypothetical protein